MNHRDRKLLDLAHKVEACMMRLPVVCKQYSHEGCEPAHNNEQRHGKGTGIKAHDYRHVAACRGCHDEYDGRTNELQLSRHQKSEFFAQGWERTIAYYFEQNWIGVK